MSRQLIRSQVIQGLERIGRSGARHGRNALRNIQTWTQTAAARRACLHATQIFRIASSRRICEETLFDARFALFGAALVLGLYILMVTVPQAGNDWLYEPVKLFDDGVNWVKVGDAGLETETAVEECHPSENEYPPLRFIKSGGPIQLYGVVCKPGFGSAQYILLEYARVLECTCVMDRDGFAYILYMMCDVMRDWAGES
ncbi:hypothetical protein BJX99DRAFT_238166 [Aspergillus californicus]